MYWSLQQPSTLADGRYERLINPQSVPGGDMAGAGGVRPRRVRVMRRFLRLEPLVARRACLTCSRLR